MGQAHAGLSEVALKLRLELPPKTPALKTAIKAELAAFDLKRSLQRLENTLKLGRGSLARPTAPRAFGQRRMRWPRKIGQVVKVYSSG